jgi:hypothetical protein
MGKERRKIRIKINDLPEDKKVSREEMKKVMGGSLIGKIWKWMGGGGGTCDAGPTTGAVGTRG